MSLPLIRPDWPAPPNVFAAMTTRAGGVSRGAYASLNLGLTSGDDRESVIENRKLLSEALALRAEPHWLEQVHGTRVVQLPCAETTPQADAAVTTSVGETCVVMAADCLPVLLCDEAGTAVAAAHAGWRGLAAGVLEATVAAMPASPSTVMAWLGPAIGPRAFEVGPEVRAAFVERDAAAAQAFAVGTADRSRADLFALARQALARAGVSNVYGGGVCTYEDRDRFFSHRRDGACGRMAALVNLAALPQKNRASK